MNPLIGGFLSNESFPPLRDGSRQRCPELTGALMEFPATSKADKTDEAAASHARIRPGGLQNTTLARSHQVTVGFILILILIRCGGRRGAADAHTLIRTRYRPLLAPASELHTSLSVI